MKKAIRDIIIDNIGLAIKPENSNDTGYEAR